MIAIIPQMKVRLYAGFIDFRNGIDGLAELCRSNFSEDPFSGILFLFRNRTSTSVKILAYDGQGFWLCQKRLSQGRFRYWPKTQEEAGRLIAQEIGVLLFNGEPLGSHMAAVWKKVG
jgi:transposase